MNQQQQQKNLKNQTVRNIKKKQKRKTQKLRVIQDNQQCKFFHTKHGYLIFSVVALATVFLSSFWLSQIRQIHFLFLMPVASLALAKSCRVEGYWKILPVLFTVVHPCNQELLILFILLFNLWCSCIRYYLLSTN